MFRQFQSNGGAPLLDRSEGPPMAFHEFYRDDFRPREHYLPMWEHLQRVGQKGLANKARDAQLALHNEGVTFTLYSDEGKGIERVWPVDILPRIITAQEWHPIEAGLKQRVRALNLFLKDLYHGQHILKDGVVPPELIYRGKDLCREIMDVDPPGDIYIHISGADLIRDEEGRYLVLEDNLRTPSGVSYMIENRVIERRILPELFSSYHVRRVEHYPDLLLQSLRDLSPRGPEEAVVVVLTPGIFNAAHFEHSFLAREMGVELAEGRDLVCKNDKVYLKTTLGLRQVDVVYRRIDDEYLDPLVFRSDSVLGAAGLINAWRAGHVALVNAPGTGVADDKAVYAYVPDIIRYYLGEAPILQSVPTYQMTDHQDRTYVLDNMEKMVVKAVAESGGKGMLMGPNSTAAQRDKFAKKIVEDPRHYIAQPVVQLSRHICYLDGELESRHLDLRPFCIYGSDIEVVPGGLTRVAVTRGSLVVNSSQGGGSKDTWVLAD
ncbi:circularly permuted type 2 ATP-grasp protein [Thiorhodococcus mannitoliphagus]|uniref:Circularly permuted type 2 ATP-grasp protein n=1 Tax=Thiorhodococcus mannitoliphagus TaxID=329406 RepID=A0A6P1DY40_9GAMM|nr:circularly permuted type 2 ATP-grasp protein [Thiorhodococcus mannitoliphagus]NEX20515.1 circularly permuted type 2 ATP-grasp protein [Thiorhodococcus mannitoliphagus]